MRKPTLCLLSILLFFASGTLLSASPWKAGYRVGIDGYDVPSISTNEYWSVSLEADMVPRLLGGPSVQVGMLLPPIPYVDPAYLSVGVGTGLFAWQEHPFKHLFRRQSALVPQIDLVLQFSFSDPHWVATSLLFQPIRFHFGDKQISILGIHVVRDMRAQAWGWGVRLFEISHYLW